MLADANEGRRIFQNQGMQIADFDNDRLHFFEIGRVGNRECNVHTASGLQRIVDNCSARKRAVWDIYSFVVGRS